MRQIDTSTARTLYR